MADLKTLGKELLATAKFMGLVTRDSGVNTGWFSNPPSQLADAGKRMDALVELLGLVLKSKIENPPAVFPHAQWHTLFNPVDLKETPFYAVTSDDRDMYLTPLAPTCSVWGHGRGFSADIA
jgi:hypothetical protein